MYLVVLAWDLTDSAVTFGELRTWVADKAAADFAGLTGVRSKAWFSNEEKRTWGAVYIVDSMETLRPGRIPRLANGKTGPVGTPPTTMSWFDLEAFVKGPADLTELLGAGLVWEEAGARAGTE
jgi:hypothetical protein